MATPDYFGRIRDRIDVDRLGRLTVCIVGAGSVGSNIAVELARCGVGSFVLIDGKRLDPGHVVRHQLGHEEVGENKAEAMSRLLADLMPEVEVDYVPYNVGEQWSSATLEEWFGDADLIVATTDDRRAQRLVNRQALALEVPAVFPGVDEAAHRGEVFVSLGGGRSPCFECWDLYRDADSSLRSVTALNVDLSQTVECAVRATLGLLDPSSEYAELYVRPAVERQRRGNRPPTLFMVSRPGVDGGGMFAGGRTFRAVYPDWRRDCPACGSAQAPARSATPRRAARRTVTNGAELLQRPSETREQYTQRLADGIMRERAQKRAQASATDLATSLNGRHEGTVVSGSGDTYVVRTWRGTVTARMGDLLRKQLTRKYGRARLSPGDRVNVWGYGSNRVEIEMRWGNPSTLGQ